MSLAVIDASVLTAFYASDDPRRDAVVARLASDWSDLALFAPADIDVEVVSGLRRLARHSPVLHAAVPAALRHLAGFPIRRMPLAPLLQRIWQLQNNVTPYGAAYVALAERLDAPLITGDSKLATAGGARCTFDLIA